MDNTRKKQLALEAANRLAAQANKELDQSDRTDQTDLVNLVPGADATVVNPTDPTEAAVSYTAIPEEHATTGKIFFPD